MATMTTTTAAPPTTTTKEWARAPAAAFSSLPKATMPMKTPVPEDINVDEILSTTLQNLPQLSPTDLDSQAFWRDVLSLTGTFRTFHGSENIATTWKELVSLRQISNIAYVAGSGYALRLGPGGFVAGRFTFRVGGEWEGDGSGIIGIYPEGEKGWKVWFFSTFLEGVDGFGDVDRLGKVGETNGAATTTTTTTTTANAGNGEQTEPEEFDAVIVGAGQAGLMTLGRLKALGLKAVALESNDAIGANWTERYDSVTLHTAKYYSTFPFGDNTFHGDDYPYYLKAKDLARGFQGYVSDYGLDVRLNSRVEKARWDETTQLWTVWAGRNGSVSMKARHVVFAVGPTGGFPSRPDIPKQDIYQGTAIHSVEFKSGKAWAGKKGIVVGTGCTGHDIAEDMVESGLSSVTMVQRNPTMVIPMQVFSKLHGSRYNAETDVNPSDQADWGLPAPILGAVSSTMFGGWRKQNPEMYDRLEGRGFKTQIPDMMKVLDRAGGHYLDVGGSQMIIDGKIHVKNGATSSFTPNGLQFDDGTTIDADLIVFATGFRTNTRDEMAKIVGEETGEQLEDNGGFDQHAEIRGGWKPQGHPKLWYTSGEFGQARWLSKVLALQIKADLVGRRFEEWKS